MADKKTKVAEETAQAAATETMNFYERVIALQNELKAPKSRFNSFANYAYRSCEDILEAVKPLCRKYGLMLTISDQIVYVGGEGGGRYYVKAQATLTDGEHYLSAEAFAREGEPKKGLESSQQSGLTSSYSRKYCLSGLLLLDDTKDCDTDEYQKQTGKRNFLAEISKMKDIADLEIWWANHLDEIKVLSNFGEIRAAANKKAEELQR